MNKITDEWEKESERKRKKGIEEEKKEEQQKVKQQGQKTSYASIKEKNTENTN